MLNLWQRAAQNVFLSPEERAFLKFVNGTLASAAMAGVSAVIPFVTGVQVNWLYVLQVFVAAFTLTVINTIQKWVTAHSPAPTVLVPSTTTAATPAAIITPVDSGATLVVQTPQKPVK